MFDDSSALTVDFHHSMLRDETRTGAFLDAILRTVRAGDVVLDIGTGTGVLSLFACVAGARKVYAVEQSPVLELAREIVARNGYDDRVEFIAGWSTAIDLPEPVDVLVTETIGNIAFDEGLVASVTDARERFLRPGGRIVPASVSLEVALIEDFDSRVEFDRWSHDLFSFDFSPLQERAIHNPVEVDLAPSALVTRPCELVAVDLAQCGAEKLHGVSSLVATRTGTVHGVGCWFSAKLTADVTLHSRPPNQVPSWLHGMLPLTEPFQLTEGDVARVEIALDAAGEEWSWRVTTRNRLDVAKGSIEQWQSTDQGKLKSEILNE